MRVDLVTLIVPEYDAAIRFFVDVLGFALFEDRLSHTTDGRVKRWVVVRPAESSTGFLLARADGEQQRAAVGRQWEGRVGLFLRVKDFPSVLDRLRAAGVAIEGAPRNEAYGQVVVFHDPFGNRWDLLDDA